MENIMADFKITPVTSGPPSVNSAAAPAKELGGGFGQVLNKAINSVNENLQEADRMSAGLASGQHANIQETMIALEKANISFRLLTKAQNKVVEAYQEIMRMQL